jgi:hypothetical protein
MKPIDTRFWEKVDGVADPEDCWEWTAYRNPNGYGQFSVGGRSGGMRLAHRVAYELLVAPIPPGLVLDHLCRNPACVNPQHLEPVSQTENVRRGVGGDVAGARSSAKTHCPQGHPYDAENTYRTPKGSRDCRRCRSAASARCLARKGKAL